MLYSINKSERLILNDSFVRSVMQIRNRDV